MSRLYLPILCTMFVAAGCAQTMYDPGRATRPYPFDKHEASSIDIQVFREGPTVEIVNSTPVAYRDVDIWINQRFTRHLDVLHAGATVQLSLWDFWDLRGDRFSAGGFWRTEEPTPLRLIQLQVNDDDPLIGLIAIYEE